MLLERVITFSQSRAADGLKHYRKVIRRHPTKPPTSVFVFASFSSHPSSRHHHHRFDGEGDDSWITHFYKKKWQIDNFHHLHEMPCKI